MMYYDEIANRPEIIKKIDEMLHGDEGAFSGIGSEIYQYTEVYCNLTGEECRENYCCDCDIAREETLNKTIKNVVGIFPTEKKENNGVEFYINFNNSVMEFGKFEDICLALKEPNWFKNLVKMESLPDEEMNYFPRWTDIQDDVLKDDKVVEYWYLKDYPMVVVCKNATFMVAPTME